jgi:hypothetical protein
MLPMCAQTVQADIIRFKNDSGGSIRDRIKLIDGINAKGDSVQIVGQFCASSCTLMLAVKRVCIGRNTVFLFHSPRAAPTNPKPLSSRDVNHWVQTAARYYPPGIREWFVTTGSKATDYLYSMKASEVARYGYPYCY